MNILHTFDTFDPIHGQIPREYPYVFAYMAERARKIIQPRNRDEIRAILKLINSIIEKGEYQFIINQIKQSQFNAINLTPPLFIKIQLDDLSHETSAQIQNLDLTWAEVFAYLALIIIEQSHKMNAAELMRLGYLNESHSIRSDQIKFELSICAMDAVCIAEQLNFKRHQTSTIALKH